MDFLLRVISTVRVWQLDGDSLTALPAIAPSGERARKQGGGPDESRVDGCRGRRLAVCNGGRSICDVDMKGKRARFEL